MAAGVALEEGDYFGWNPGRYHGPRASVVADVDVEVLVIRPQDVLRLEMIVSRHRHPSNIDWRLKVGITQPPRRRHRASSPHSPRHTHPPDVVSADVVRRMPPTGKPWCAARGHYGAHMKFWVTYPIIGHPYDPAFLTKDGLRGSLERQRRPVFPELGSPIIRSRPSDGTGRVVTMPSTRLPLSPFAPLSPIGCA